MNPCASCVAQVLPCAAPSFPKSDLRRQTERGSLYFKAHAAYAQRLNYDEGA